MQLGPWLLFPPGFLLRLSLVNFCDEIHFHEKKDKRRENETSMACHMLSFDKRFDKLFTGFTLNQRDKYYLIFTTNKHANKTFNFTK